MKRRAVGLSLRHQFIRRGHGKGWVPVRMLVEIRHIGGHLRRGLHKGIKRLIDGHRFFGDEAGGRVQRLVHQHVAAALGDMGAELLLTQPGGVPKEAHAREGEGDGQGERCAEKQHECPDQLGANGTLHAGASMDIPLALRKSRVFGRADWISQRTILIDRTTSNPSALTTHCGNAPSNRQPVCLSIL